ncbi:dephospho-CoA kinase [Clostridium minihomine]|uniref:dephospho-CoA kinase n=1 Tax=Clostridium minihomine TaxID=2045012 RepID=UPI000C76C76B|nr:dephospho-CoA kinase [Clostridium minihomine]
MTDSVIIGLTGPTGAGKSTVAGLMKELGCAVIDCDRTAKRVLVECRPCVEELKEEFGADIVGGDGQVDRGLLARRAFATPAKALRLNQITHPWILKELRMEIDAFRAQGFAFIIVDAPLLFESGADAFCDRILAVTAPQPIRLERIIRRDKIDKELALSRIHAQQQDVYYTGQSDAWLSGDTDPNELRQQAASILERWRK